MDFAYFFLSPLSSFLLIINNDNVDFFLYNLFVLCYFVVLIGAVIIYICKYR